MSPQLPPRHLVLGGSGGIGSAYAERYARRGDQLMIVARGAASLRATRQVLLAEGAATVETIACDLADANSRTALVDRLADGAPFSTVFVGGPGPVPGRAHRVNAADHERAQEVCIAYPSQFLEMAGRLVESGGRLVLLSSSTADEPLKEHRFYLSALYRRRLDQLLKQRSASLKKAKIELIVLKPKVVLTAHSEAFARAIDPSRNPSEVLAAYFASHVELPTDLLEKLPENHLFQLIEG